jgi:hypothetical protein
METVSVEVFVVVDADGESVVADSEEGAIETYRDNVGNNVPTRVIKISLAVPVPQAVTLTGVVPVEPTTGAELKVEG